VVRLPERLTHWSAKKSPLKKEPFYIERNEEKRADFDKEIAGLPPETDIVYVDECGVSKHMSREYGRAKRGKRLYLGTCGRRFKRLNCIGGMAGGAMLARMAYEWNTNAAWFNEWFEWFLCPLLKQGSVIVMDNAAFHNKSEIHRIAASYGCVVIFLPPYSPDKNKIEKYWANLKNWLRLNSKYYTTIQDAVMAYFKRE
jgi:transposase